MFETIRKFISGGPEARRGIFTVAFTNMNGYMGVCEKVPVERLSEFMNRFLSTQYSVIQNHEGSIGSFPSPDSVMAFWSDDHGPERAATLACESALQQFEAMEAFQKWSIENGFPSPTIRIGIHSGDVTFGNLGSRDNPYYTVLGDTVNTAARLEAQARNAIPSILISEDTFKLVSDFAVGQPITLSAAFFQKTAYPLLRRGQV